jgi:hypothetical protein
VTWKRLADASSVSPSPSRQPSATLRAAKPLAAWLPLCQAVGLGQEQARHTDRTRYRVPKRTQTLARRANPARGVADEYRYGADVRANGLRTQLAPAPFKAIFLPSCQTTTGISQQTVTRPLDCASFRFALSTVPWDATLRRVGCKVFLDQDTGPQESVAYDRSHGAGSVIEQRCDCDSPLM